MARRAGIIRKSSDAGDDNSSKRERENKDVEISYQEMSDWEKQQYRKQKFQEPAKEKPQKRKPYDSKDRTCDGQRPEIEDMNKGRNGFWSFFMPSIQGNVHSASESIEKGDRDSHRWAEANIKSAEKRLNEARRDTDERIEKRSEEVKEEVKRDRNWLTSSIWGTEPEPKPEPKPDKKSDNEGRTGSFFW